MTDQVFAAFDFDTGLAASRPATPTVSNGRLYVYAATDTHVVSIWDGAAWCSTGGGSPTGAAGGALGGTYPNPTLAVPHQPGGRLTLTTLTPVLTQDVSGATTIFYTPYVGATVPLYNGATWVQTTFAELSQTLADTTKSPAAAVLNSLYDMFVWNDAGTIRCTRGPKWTVSPAPSARGVGAGTTELATQDGFRVNKFAITNGPPALQGLYVGTILTNPSVTVNMHSFPTPVAGGSGNFLSVWNKYNRATVTSLNRDNSASHTYTSTTFQVKAASNPNGTNFICGEIEDQFVAIDTEVMSSTVADAAYIAWGLNSTTIQANFPITEISEQVVGKAACGTVTLCDYPTLGANTVYPLEATQATGVHTFTTNAAIGGVNVITGTVFMFRM